MNTPPIEFRRGIATMRYKHKTIVQIIDRSIAYPDIRPVEFVVYLRPIKMSRTFVTKEEAIDVAVVWYNRLTLQQ